MMLACALLAGLVPVAFVLGVWFAMAGEESWKGCEADWNV